MGCCRKREKIKLIDNALNESVLKRKYEERSIDRLLFGVGKVSDLKMSLEEVTITQWFRR